MTDLHPVLAAKGIKPGTKEAFIAVAQYFADKKYTEQPANSNNSLFGAWYGMNGAAWCAMFVSYCLNKSGNGSTINGAQSKKGYALCSKGIKWFQKKKAWYPVTKAQPGDVAFFDWDHNGSPDHTGLVVKVNLKKKEVLCIEGNTGHTNLSNGGAVLKQWRKMSAIIGVGRPAFPATAPVVATPATPVEPPKPTPPAPTPAKPATPVAKPLPTLRLGSKGVAVKTLQTKLHITVDGSFGPQTKAAVVAFQKKHGLTPDGVVGPLTWGKLK